MLLSDEVEGKLGNPVIAALAGGVLAVTLDDRIEKFKGIARLVHLVERIDKVALVDIHLEEIVELADGLGVLLWQLRKREVQRS